VIVRHVLRICSGLRVVPWPLAPKAPAGRVQQCVRPRDQGRSVGVGPRQIGRRHDSLLHGCYNRWPRDVQSPTLLTARCVTPWRSSSVRLCRRSVIVLMIGEAVSERLACTRCCMASCSQSLARRVKPCCCERDQRRNACVIVAQGARCRAS
jgi:hypothetical protein